MQNILCSIDIRLECKEYIGNQAVLGRFQKKFEFGDYYNFKRLSVDLINYFFLQTLE